MSFYHFFEMEGQIMSKRRWVFIFCVVVSGLGTIPSHKALALFEGSLSSSSQAQSDQSLITKVRELESRVAALERALLAKSNEEVPSNQNKSKMTGDEYRKLGESLGMPRAEPRQ